MQIECTDRCYICSVNYRIMENCRDKQKMVDAINSKFPHNNLVELYYNVGRALPFTAQRFPDGRVSDWYRSQYVEVVKVEPRGKYGKVYGFYYRNGERADSSDVEACCWCKKNDKEPQEIPNSGCGSWALLNIIGEPTSEAIKVMGLDDTLDFGKYKGKKLSEVIINDWQYVKWAVLGSQRLFVDIEEIVAFHEENMPRLTPADKMTFGKYKDRTLQEVYNEDQQYLRWLEDKNSSFRVDWNLFS